MGLSRAKKESKKKINSSVFDSQQDEFYRQLRTNIEFSSVNNQMQVVCITSSQPDEGKTTTATNLARVCASKYESVLLVDCDLRKSSIHKAFKVSNSFGLSNIFLESEIDVDDERYYHCFKDSNSTGKLYVLPSGIKVPNPQELLSSMKFSQLIDQFRKKFDFIILDCPPMLAVSDAIPVANIADGTVFVVSAQETNKKAAKRALTQLQRSGAHVIGAVLSKAETESDKYNYYYDYNN